MFDEVLPTIRKTGGYGNQLTRLTNLVEQLTQVTANLIQAATAITVAVSTLMEKRMADTWAPQPNRPFPINDGYNATRCKLETFPSEITEQVDGMLGDMLRQQVLNFSMIARYCTMNGYTISSPAVKTYFLRHFNEA